MLDFVTFLLSIPVVSLVGYVVYQHMELRRLKKSTTEVVNTRVVNEQLNEQNRELLINQRDLEDQLGEEREKNRTIVSQKKSSETRLGQISEQLIPVLDSCTHNPKNMHFLGNPIDYLVFDLDQGMITFLEVKSGNSKPSKRQKTIKNLIKLGRVQYEEMRVNEKGVRSKFVKNQESQADTKHVK